RHTSRNGNVWLTSNLPKNDECDIKVSLYGGIIKKPKQQYLYTFNNEIGPTLFKNTFIIGNIKIEVNASDNPNVSKVEFFIDGVKQFEDIDPPFEWLWNKLSFFKHTLLVKTYYTHGYQSEDKIDLWKFF
ncbi:unnamed protein product, partial [marine sediment metagenome]